MDDGSPLKWLRFIKKLPISHMRFPDAPTYRFGHLHHLRIKIPYPIHFQLIISEILCPADLIKLDDDGHSCPFALELWDNTKYYPKHFLTSAFPAMIHEFELADEV